MPRKDELAPSEFLKLPELPEQKRRFFVCLCGNKIYVPNSETIRCPMCKSVWKLKTSFAQGTKHNKGFQLPYQI